jgi:tetratricopeptide (TPR) repeat protein
MARRHREQGEGALSYLAVILLVGAVAAAVTLVAVPDQVTAGIKAAVCRVTGGDDCGPERTPAGSATPSTPSPGASGATGEPQALPGNPEQEAYDRARAAAAAADRDVAAADQEFADLRKELWDFLLDLVGYKQAEKCFKELDIMACIETLATAIPWGKAFKVLKKIPGAIKLAKRLKQVWDRAAAARKKRDDAQRALKKAEDDLRKKNEKLDPKKLACPVGGQAQPNRLRTRPIAAGGATGPAPQWPLILTGGTGRITPVLARNAADCGPPVRIKPGQQAAGGSYKMTKAELKFVKDLLAKKPNLQVFRTDGHASMGDFVIIDLSNPREPVGWIVELKTSSGGFPGEQFRNADTIARQLGLKKFKKVAGTPEEMLEELNKGRSQWN